MGWRSALEGFRRRSCPPAVLRDFPLRLVLVPRYDSLPSIAKAATLALTGGLPRTAEELQETLLPALRRRIQSQTTLRFEVADQGAFATYYVEAEAYDADGARVAPFSAETHATYEAEAIFLAFLRLRA